MYEDIADHLLPWLKQEPAPPFRIHIFPTDRCNLKCHSCWRWGANPKGEIPWSVNELSKKRLLGIIEEAAGLGVREIELTGGGEPMLRSDVTLAMMKKIKELKIRGSMTTNATLFALDDIKFLIGIDWDSIIISLDGPNPAINDFLRPPKGTFKKVMQTLEWIRDCRSSAGKSVPELAIQCVLSKPNISHIVPMIELAAKFNIQNIIFDPMKVCSARGDRLAVSGEGDLKIIQNQLGRAKELVNEHKILPMFSDILYTLRL